MIGLDTGIAVALAGLFVSALIVFFAAPESREDDFPVTRPRQGQPDS